MSFKTTAMLVTLGLAALTTPLAFGADGDAMQSFQKEMMAMANKDGMVSKKDFMAMMEKRWNAMDKAKKGMLSTSDVMKIFSDKTGQ